MQFKEGALAVFTGSIIASVASIVNIGIERKFWVNRYDQKEREIEKQQRALRAAMAELYSAPQEHRSFAEMVQDRISHELMGRNER